MPGRVEVLTRFDGALTEAPVWSPDGRYLAFSSNAGGARDIWQADVMTGGLEPVTQGADGRYPVWLPE